MNGSKRTHSEVLEDIRQNCRIDVDTGCWSWRGALSEGKWPRVWAPNLSRPGEPLQVQTGRRAVWQLSTGKPIPAGYRVYGTCSNGQCLNPSHMKCGPCAEWGMHKTLTGVHKTIRHSVGARKTGRARSVLTPETYAEVINSTETGVAIAARLGVSIQTISKARTGQMTCFKPVGGPFTALIR